MKRNGLLDISVQTRKQSFCVLHLYPMKTNTQLLDHQYSETNVMHFLFNLLRIKGLYIFRALLAHPQEALHTALGILRAEVSRHLKVLMYIVIKP
jgi:hypothetical protein